MTVRGALTQAAARLTNAGIPSPEAIIEARLLAIHVFNISREQLLLSAHSELSPENIDQYFALIARREQREPLAYIVGTREFYGLSFTVSPSVLIPRPETEFVVEAVLRHIKGREDARVVDVGTGSGAIAVAVAAHAPHAQVWGTDISADALAVAQSNADRNGVASRTTFFQGDLLDPVADTEPYDIIASNPPYIAASAVEELQPEVRDFEPRIALGIHTDDLHFYRRLAEEAPPLLVPGGLLVVEVGQGQAAAVAELWQAAGLIDVEITNDYAAIGRVVTGLLPELS